MASNYFDKASLVMIPDAPLEGKVLSVKPEDRSGDFTFSRGSNLAATRVDVNGLIEKGRENLLLQSNQFDTWSATSGTSVTSGQSGYDGSNNAWLLNDSGTSPSYAIYRDYTNTGVQTFSIYAKQASTSQIEFDFLGGGGGYLRVELTDGSLHQTNNTIDYKIEDAGNGWWRCSFTANQDSAPIFVRIGCYGAGSIYIQNAQVEQGLVATDYIETGASTAQAGITDNLPRLDYTDSSCPALLLEPQRTNLVVLSEYPSSNTTSGYPYVRGNAIATYNYGVSPEGVQNSTFISGSNGNNGVQVNFTSSAVNQDWSYSFYIKGIAGKTAHLRFELSPFYNNGAEYITFTGGWQRIEKTISYDAAVHTGKHWYITFLGASTATQFEIYGLQAEADASYATSYIPTYGGSVSRVGDSIDSDEFQTKGIISSTQGTMFFDIKEKSGTAVHFNIQNQSSLDYALRFQLRDNGFVIFQKTPTAQTTIRSVAGLTPSRYKIAMSWNETSLITSFNGTSYIDTIDASIASQLNKIQRPNINQVSVTTNQILVFPTQLTEAELNDLTTL